MFYGENGEKKKVAQFCLTLLLLERLRLFAVVPFVSGVWFRLFLEPLFKQFVLFSLRIDDFVNFNGGGALVDSVAVEVDAVVAMAAAAAAAAAVAICELTFHGHANGGAFDTVSCKHTQSLISMTHYNQMKCYECK